MLTTITTLGIACIVAAIVGGGFKGMGIEIPVIKTLHRQLTLALIGVVLIIPGGLEKWRELHPPIIPAEELAAGLSAYDNGNLSLALEHFQKAAKAGDKEGEYHYGEMLFHGEGIIPDKRKGVYWIQRSANKGFALAQASLAVATYMGDGIEKDESKGKHWAELGAQQNSCFALNVLASMTADKNEKSKLLRKAAEMGYAESQVSLALITKDIMERGTWYAKAGKQGHPVGQVGYGMMMKAFGDAENDNMEAKQNNYFAAYMSLFLALRASGHNRWELPEEIRADIEKELISLEKKIPLNIVLKFKSSDKKIVPEASCSYRHGHDD